MYLCSDEQVQLSTETQHLKTHLLRAELDRHQRPLHVQLN